MVPPINTLQKAAANLRMARNPLQRLGHAESELAFLARHNAGIANTYLASAERVLTGAPRDAVVAARTLVDGTLTNLRAPGIRLPGLRSADRTLAAALDQIATAVRLLT